MNPFEPSGFWHKSVLFINRALEPVEKGEDERRIWASLALELLSKWALASTSPTLIADASGPQMFKALGLRSADANNVSVAANTAFSRCADLFKPFNEQRAKKISDARNDYIHGAGLNIMNLPTDAWWSEYWALVQILLAAHGRQITELVGNKNTEQVELSLQRNRKRVEEHVIAVTESAKRDHARFSSESMTTGEVRRWNDFKMRPLLYNSTADCPACGELGTVSANHYDSSETEWPEPEYHEDYEGPEAIAVIVFTPERFECPTCHLVLSSLEQISQASAQLANAYTIEQEQTFDYEPDYGND